MNTKSIALRSLLVALAVLLSWLEAQIPPLVMVPGMKLGLTNVVVLVALYKLGVKDAFAVNMVRIILVGFTFGNFYSMSYALAGGLVSFLSMYIVYKFLKLNVSAVSVTGGIMHNIGQILIAMVVVSSTKLLYYLPFLWASGIGAGLVIGLLSSALIQRLPNLNKR